MSDRLQDDPAVPPGSDVRLVCLGDSFTEGMSDHLRPDGHHRGWADRVAQALARRSATTGGTLRYANLAVRGKLLDQVVTDQLPVAASLSPTLLTFHAGPNDVLRTRRLDDLLRRYAEAVATASEAVDGRLLLFTSIGRAGGTGGLARDLAARFDRFNDNVRSVATQRDAVLVDLGAVEVLTDRRVWDVDRLHLNPDGHARVAAAVLERLGVVDPGLLGGPVGWWRAPLPAAATVSASARLAADLVWTRSHLLPWLSRRLRGVSSGDGMTAKDPELRPVPVDVPPP